MRTKLSNQDRDKMFKIIAEEIVVKQNGLDMSSSDLSSIKNHFVSSGGDADGLVAGVMDEFDGLKDAIVAHYESSPMSGGGDAVEIQPGVFMVQVGSAADSTRRRITAARVFARSMVATA